MPSSDAELLRYEVLIIGAGAAGLVAAARAAERRRSTLLLEKNRKPGVKILMSGGTRCNITHDCESAGIIAAFGAAGRFLHSALAALGPHELVAFFNEEGLPTKVEPGGKVFPSSDRAVDVLDALLRRLHRSGADVELGEGVTGVAPDGDCFCITTRSRMILANKLIITTGGKSYPGCGTTGDGYAWLAAMGHTIRRPCPALVPLTSDETWVRELSGLTVTDAIVRVVDLRPDEHAGRRRRRGGLPLGTLIERRGSLLFAHFGLSGPAILDVSRAVTAAADLAHVALNVDFLPDTTAVALDESLRRAAEQGGKRTIVAFIAEQLPRRLSESLIALAEVPGDRRIAELTKVERGRIVEALKNSRIRISGSRGFDKAEVTAGGVALDEVDSRTMESKLVPGLFIAGEVLDLDGFIGGYNFQAAFSTGWLAGESV